MSSIQFGTGIRTVTDIAASARQIEKLGFDIVTYKTIRSRKHNCHPLPNMLYVDVDHKKKIATLRDNLPEDIAHLGVTNSFGMPSMDKDYLMEDIKKAHEGLGKNQVLVVSFVGTPSE
ncbi:MAG: hypothetical protein COC20_06690, partial [Cellvibrionales bacterium]